MEAEGKLPDAIACVGSGNAYRKGSSRLHQTRQVLRWWDKPPAGHSVDRIKNAATIATQRPGIFTA